MAGTTEEMSADVGKETKLNAQCYDNVLRPHLLSAAQAVFGKNAHFWSEHQYPTPSFFSYYYELEQNPTFVFFR